MTMRDAKNDAKTVNAIAPQTITSSAVNSGDVDLFGYNGAKISVVPGSIDGLNSGSPTPGTVAVKLEHADDDGTGSPGSYANVAATDVTGPSSVSAGLVATLSETNVLAEVGYVGDKRFIRVTLTPASLGSGGPIAAVVEKRFPRHGPAS